MHFKIDQALSQVRTAGELKPEAWPEEVDLLPEDIGLHLNSRQRWAWPSPPETLDRQKLARAFADWQVEVFDCIDSTNTYLLQNGNISQRLCIAELQLGGRGRRGRKWLSPYARNLAMSMGFNSRRPVTEMGGLSSVVGLAMLAGLESVGISQGELKWPNDILVDNRKLVGVLVELINQGGLINFVVGVGINVILSDQEAVHIGQPVTDLRCLGVEHSRTELAITFVRYVREFVQHFEAEGFAAFVQAFNAAHKFHGQRCWVIQGEDSIEGVVLGIGDTGELILETQDGELRCHGGEVSLRSVPDQGS